MRQYSKSKTDEAGDILRQQSVSGTKANEALIVLSAWRAAHAYPMHVFKMRLKRLAEKLSAEAITAQRLKRVPSIIKKLNRIYEGHQRPIMKLTQMQDIAGCRAVMPTFALADQLYRQHYRSTKGDLKHLKVNEKNYVEYPKKDGYRSIHLVYRYRSDKGKKQYNGLLIEVQIRSLMQHIWATAVETVDFFTGQAIKSNEGEEEWKEFFRLVSSAFALKENTPVVPGTPDDKKELYKLIRQKENQLNVVSKMEKWTSSIRFFDDLKENKDAHYFLLELDTVQEKLTISSFTKRQENKAIDAYAAAEKKIYGEKQYDVVLVGADDMEDLKKAYPNYFIDTRFFLEHLKRILKAV